MNDDPRLNNGVRRRVDGLGDGFANGHRLGLPTDCFFQDVDGLLGFMAFAQNTGDRLFVEYVPDHYQNVLSRVRRFAIVSLFDRKSTIEVARRERNTLCSALYLEMCRRLAVGQPIAPRFFWVCGGHLPPWTLYELDIKSGEEIGEARALPFLNDWRAVWQAFGLFDNRATLQEWLSWTSWMERSASRNHQGEEI